MGPIPLTENENKYILSCKERLSEYQTDIPIRDQEAETVQRALIEKVITVFGSPGSILTECASKFTGEFMRLLRRHVKILKIITILFRPHSNAKIEKSHAIRVFTEYLRHLICKDQNNWETLWPTAALPTHTK